MNTVIILDGLKFDWKQKEIDRAKQLFNCGIKPTIVSELMNEKIENISLLLIHLIERGEINEQTISKKKNHV